MKRYVNIYQLNVINKESDKCLFKKKKNNNSNNLRQILRIKRINLFWKNFVLL